MTGDQLLRAVLAQPEDLARRLVYADYLQHHDDPQGELIALQCQAATLAAADPSRIELELRARALITAHGGTWAARLGEGTTEVHYRLGLATSAKLTARHDALAALDRAPLRDIGFTNPRDRTSFATDTSIASLDEDIALAAHLAADPRFARIELLATGIRWGSEALRVMLGSPHLAQLRGLRIPDGDARPYAGRALEHARLPALEMLAICGDWQSEAGDETVLYLARSRLPALRSLELLNLACTPRAVDYLATSTTIGLLHQLDFGWGSYHANRIGAAGAARIASAELFRNLKKLVLDFNGVGDAGFVALGDAQLPALRRLSVKDNGITDEGLRAFVATTGLPKLEVLELAANRSITEIGIAALAESPRLASLSTLWLAQLPLGSDGARAIADSPYARNLRDLNLLDCQLGDEGVRALLASPHLDGLVKLQLGRNAVMDDTAIALRARWGNGVRIDD